MYRRSSVERRNTALTGHTEHWQLLVTEFVEKMNHVVLGGVTTNAYLQAVCVLRIE